MIIPWKLHKMLDSIINNELLSIHFAIVMILILKIGQFPLSNYLLSLEIAPYSVVLHPLF
jgi:hypothetical protein